MTVLALTASPRRQGNSELLLGSFLKGVQSEGLETETIRLNDLTFRPCQACDRCAPTGKCVVQDDMQTLYPKIISCSALILTTPIYFGSLSAQLKMFIDRFQCWWHAKYNLDKPFIKPEEKRPAYFICVGALKKKDYSESAKNIVSVYCHIVNLNLKGSLCFRGYDEPGSIAQAPEHLERAFQEGAAFAKVLK